MERLKMNRLGNKTFNYNIVKSLRKNSQIQVVLVIFIASLYIAYLWFYVILHADIKWWWLFVGPVQTDWPPISSFSDLTGMAGLTLL
jgi:hypothetical protein